MVESWWVWGALGDEPGEGTGEVCPGGAGAGTGRLGLKVFFREGVDVEDGLYGGW